MSDRTQHLDISDLLDVVARLLKMFPQVRSGHSVAFRLAGSAEDGFGYSVGGEGEVSYWDSRAALRALAMAAVVGPAAPSPAPTEGSSGRSIRRTSMSGTSENVMIG